MASHPADRAPDVSRRFIAGVCLVLGLLCAATEVASRAADVQPSLTDSAGLWAIQRAGVTRQSMVLVGSSRFQVGIDPSRLASNVVNLSLLGDSPIPVLQHLARDQTFAGHAVVEFMPLRYCTPDLDGILRARDMVQRFDRRAAIADLETQMRVRLQARLSMLNSSLRPLDLLTGAQSLAAVQQQVVGRDRFAPRDYRGTDTSQIVRLREERWRERLSTPLSDDQHRERIARIEDAISAIRARGGEVTFFRINSSGRAAALEAEHAPRAACYERWVSALPDARWLHFADLPAIAGLELPEGSHLDRSQTAVVTDALRGALARGSDPADPVE